jgi:hypothetical protein
VVLSLRGVMTMPGVKLPGWDDLALICLFAPRYGGGPVNVTAASVTSVSGQTAPLTVYVFDSNPSLSRARIAARSASIAPTAQGCAGRIR